MELDPFATEEELEEIARQRREAREKCVDISVCVYFQQTILRVLREYVARDTV